MASKKADPQLESVLRENARLMAEIRAEFGEISTIAELAGKRREVYASTPSDPLPSPDLDTSDIGIIYSSRGGYGGPVINGTFDNVQPRSAEAAVDELVKTGVLDAIDVTIATLKANLVCCQRTRGSHGECGLSRRRSYAPLWLASS